MALEICKMSWTLGVNGKVRKSHSKKKWPRGLPTEFRLASIGHSFWPLKALMTFPVLKSSPNNSYKCQFFSFQCQVEKKVLFNFQKLTSAEEQTMCDIQSECMPCGKNIFLLVSVQKKNFDDPK